MEREHIQLFDTTLRDGQQCPGAGMSLEKNLQYAEFATLLGIDVIEAGFPAASRLDFDIVHTIVKQLVAYENGPVVAALCQLREVQFEVTIQALAPLISRNRARLHTYLPVDENLMKASLGKYSENKSQMVEDIYRLTRIACQAGLSVELSPEGYSQLGNNFDFVTDMIRAAITAGATIINCPDTIGGACWRQGKNYFVHNMQRHADIIAAEFPDRNITWSMHCHNDFGLALENTMYGVFAGPARQIEGCFNGIGERAGNVALEQCIMYIEHFGADKFYTQANLSYLQQCSDFVCEHMLPRQPHWPITGDNAARHSSGGHINAIIKDPLSYQPFNPKKIGKGISFVFGPMSGGNHAKTIIERHGYQCDDNEKAAIAQYIKQYYTDRRKGITDEELMSAYFSYRTPMVVTAYHYQQSSTGSCLQIVGKFFTHDKGFEINCQHHQTTLSALNDAISSYYADYCIENYTSESVSKGIDALSRTTIMIKTENAGLYTGIGEDEDIEVSSLKALVKAVNKAYIEQHYKLMVGSIF